MEFSSFGQFSSRQVTYRLTYDDVEEMLLSGLAGSSEEWELGRLSELSMMRYRWVAATGCAWRVMCAIGFGCTPSCVRVGGDDWGALEGYPTIQISCITLRTSAKFW